jgi:nucleotide-binding universal stress UspA family protein
VTHQPKVLVALDLGDPSTEALRQGRRLAHDLEAALGVVHVLPAAAELAALFPEGSLSLLADEQAVAARTRQTLEEHARQQLGLELGTVFVERGPADAEIVRCAQAWDADYVVVGSHGRSGLSRMLLGSVAERVVRQAPCSVLVARQAPSPGVVLVATDLSPASVPAIEAGAAAARRRNAKLVVISVLEWPGAESVAWAALFGPVPAIPGEETRAERRDAARRIVEQSLVAAAATGEVLLRDGSAATQIVRASEELGAELVVVGTHGRTGLERLALGSVAERVIRSAPCSVLAVRAER